MAQLPINTSSTPMTEDAFLADRQKFWSAFTGATTFGVGFLVVLLILMAVFLL